MSTTTPADVPESHPDGLAVEVANLALAQRYADAWNAHDLAAIMALHTDDTGYELHGRSGRATGKAEVAAQFAAELAAMPDIAFELESIHDGPDHIVFRSRVSGTVRGRPVVHDVIDLLVTRAGLVHTKDTYLASAR
jgi:ketosteroid isomerase-like protein